MRDCSDVAVVGAGLAGAAIAHECCVRGMDVVVVEEETAGAAGATRYSGGIVRGFDPDPCLMHWGVEGAHAWRGWELPGPPVFRPCGALYLIGADQVGGACTAAAVARLSGYPIEIVAGAQISSRFPWLALPRERISAVSVVYEPLGGYCEPRVAAKLYCDSVRASGGRVVERARVHDLQESSERVTLRTQAGSVSAKLAVIAAGAASVELCDERSVFVRSIPLSRFEPLSAAHELASCVIDGEHGGYGRGEPSGNVLFGGAEQKDAAHPRDLPPFAEAHHAQHLQKLRKLLPEARLRPLEGFMGYDAYTPSFHPVLGFRDGATRICRAFGFSGRGAKYIPALAPVLADRISQRLRALQ